MNTQVRKYVVALLAPLAFASFSQAATINLLTADAAFIGGAANPNESSLTKAAAALNGGTPASHIPEFATTLYKNSSGSESGTLMDFYAVNYSIDNNSGNATITHSGNSFAVGTYLLAKDGDRGSYLWDISDWNGLDTLYIANPWLAAQGKLKSYSHIQFWGGSGTKKVPDAGSTALLFGAAMIALGALARRRASV
jgi:hypothetical protein